MNKMIVVTKTDQVNGFRLAGVDAIGVDDVEAVEKLISSWLDKKEKILLALDDDLFSDLPISLVNKIYDTEDILLVTIPSAPVSAAETGRKKRIYDMIRHATGVQIRFRGEEDGTTKA